MDVESSTPHQRLVIAACLLLFVFILILLVLVPVVGFKVRTSNTKAEQEADERNATKDTKGERFAFWPDVRGRGEK